MAKRKPKPTNDEEPARRGTVIRVYYPGPDGEVRETVTYLPDPEGDDDEEEAVEWLPEEVNEDEG
jgi:hypothetical protein